MKPKVSKTTPWSYSSIKQFEQCPRKYYHLRVAKDYVDTPNDSAIYGDEVHKAAELRVKDGTPVPDKYSIIREPVEKMLALPGEKYAELKLGVAKNGDRYEPCDFFARHGYYRGIVDLLVVNRHRGYLVDWKSGSSKYADARQLDLMAGAVFVNYPQIDTIRAGLAFVASGELVEKNYGRWELEKCLSVFDRELKRLDAAQENDVWNAKDGPLCGWCPVKSCPHWRERRK